ncbi:MAG: maltose ABC transporter permease MalF [Lentisphaerota bacterium]
MDKSRFFQELLYTLVAVAVLVLDVRIFLSGHDVLGFSILMVLALFCFVYAWQGAYVYRYLFPSLTAFSVFVILPLVYTIYISFTNYSAMNLQTFADAKDFIARESDTDMSRRFDFQMFPVPGKDGQYSLVFSEKTPGTTTTYFAASPFIPAGLQGDNIRQLDAAIMPSADLPTGLPLKISDIIKIRDPLKKLLVRTPSQATLKMLSFTSFAPQKPVWTFVEESDLFTNAATGVVLKPDFTSGFFVNTLTREKYGPGFRVSIGWDNYKRIFTDPSVRQPFLTVFIWTVVFAFLSVLLTFVLGLILSVLLEWKAIKGRRMIRALLILPYSVPAFISILIFKGLFNPQFGEINAILHGLFGISPEWTTQPTLAKTMILLVNLWLGYPYMMILCTGILQSVPEDLYEASSIDGGGPINNLLNVTIPMILPPLKPLLIASFAFNFNNFLLIQLLTAGAPPIVGAATQVGYTDILVTYTFNLAFRGGVGGGNYFGFAAAIATIIFILVSVLSYLNFKASTRGDTARN